MWQTLVVKNYVENVIFTIVGNGMTVFLFKQIKFDICESILKMPKYRVFCILGQ